MIFLWIIQYHIVVVFEEIVKLFTKKNTSYLFFLYIYNITVNDSPKMTIDTAGFIGVGTTNPGFPIEVATANNARLETTGNWVNPSSRQLKENIKTLTSEEAINTLNELNPVKYNYKVDKEEGYVGFIAEDVPGLVAVKDRKGLVTMDVVAVLTKVVQEQQSAISDLNKKIAELEKKSDSNK
jgi:hypothetical protein